MAAILTDADYAQVAALWLKACQASGRFAIEDSEWEGLLGPRLFKLALNSGYFGPPGALPGVDYSGIAWTGVSTTTTDDGYRLDLYEDGELVASGTFGQPQDIVEFAAKHGVKI
jgi:hypothetical protein